MALVSRSFDHRSSPVKVKLIKPESLAQVSLMDNKNKVENYPGINFSRCKFFVDKRGALRLPTTSKDAPAAPHPH